MWPLRQLYQHPGGAWEQEHEAKGEGGEQKLHELVL